jgi:hypothetical protein
MFDTQPLPQSGKAIAIFQENRTDFISLTAAAAGLLDSGLSFRRETAFGKPGFGLLGTAAEEGFSDASERLVAEIGIGDVAGPRDGGFGILISVSSGEAGNGGVAFR